MLVGFGAEEGEEGLERKRRMLADKHLDLVVFNDVSRADIGFDAADNEVVLVGGRRRADGRRRRRRSEIAAEILDEVERLLAVPLTSGYPVRARCGVRLRAAAAM